MPVMPGESLRTPLQAASTLLSSLDRLESLLQSDNIEAEGVLLAMRATQEASQKAVECLTEQMKAVARAEEMVDSLSVLLRWVMLLLQGCCHQFDQLSLWHQVLSGVNDILQTSTTGHSTHRDCSISNKSGAHKKTTPGDDDLVQNSTLAKAAAAGLFPSMPCHGSNLLESLLTDSVDMCVPLQGLNYSQPHTSPLQETFTSSSFYDSFRTQTENSKSACEHDRSTARCQCQTHGENWQVKYEELLCKYCSLDELQAHLHSEIIQLQQQCKQLEAQRQNSVERLGEVHRNDVRQLESSCSNDSDLLAQQHVCWHPTHTKKKTDRAKKSSWHRLSKHLPPRQKRDPLDHTVTPAN